MGHQIIFIMLFATIELRQTHSRPNHVLRTYSQWSNPPPPLERQGLAGAFQYREPERAVPTYPSCPSAVSTAHIRHAGLEAQADISGRPLSIAESFIQLRNDITHTNFISALGKYAVDDPAKLHKLALANLRENPHARNNLASLHSARTCLYGSRELGDKKLFTDKPGIASRLKTQAQRRQFRLGLVANLGFFNRLNQGDLLNLLVTGDRSDLGSLSLDTRWTVPQLADALKRVSPIDILRLLAPGKAATVLAQVQRITDVADYAQSVCNRLAANEALEPAHAVICRLLQTGADFKAANLHRPFHLATQAVAPLCRGPDMDGFLSRRTPGGTTGGGAGPHSAGPYPKGFC